MNSAPLRPERKLISQRDLLIHARTRREGRRKARVVREGSVFLRIFRRDRSTAAGEKKHLREVRWYPQRGSPRKSKTFTADSAAEADRLALEFASTKAIAITNGVALSAELSPERRAMLEYCVTHGLRLLDLQNLVEGKAEGVAVEQELGLRISPRELWRRGLASLRAERGLQHGHSTQGVLDEMLLLVKARAEAKRIRDGTSKISTENLRVLRLRLTKFAAAFPLLDDLARDPIEHWVNAHTSHARTREHYLDAVFQFLRFARRKQYLTQQRLEDLLGIERFEPSAPPADPHRAEELRELLDWCELNGEEDFIPTLVLVALVGFRECEVMSEKGAADWKHLKLDEAQALVCAGHSKVGENRLIPIPENALPWLRRYARPGPICPVKDVSKKLKRICDRAHVQKRDNGLRSGYISHDVAQRRDMASTAFRAGTSVQKIKDDYLNLEWMSKKEVESWQRITPRDLQLPLLLSPHRHHAAAPARINP